MTIQWDYTGAVFLLPRSGVLEPALFSIAFDTTAESWLKQQVLYDLWQAEQHRSELQVKKLSPEKSEYA